MSVGNLIKVGVAVAALAGAAFFSFKSATKEPDWVVQDAKGAYICEAKGCNNEFEISSKEIMESGKPLVCPKCGKGEDLIRGYKCEACGRINPVSGHVSVPDKCKYCKASMTPAPAGGKP